MFGSINYRDIPAEICHINCPRVYPSHDEEQLRQDSEKKSTEVALPLLPVEYVAVYGRIIYPERLKPCYLYIRLTRPHCRELRNFIVTNSTKLSVIKGDYCGIAPKVFNVKRNSVEPTTSLGLLRFTTTDHALRFIISENRIGGPDFLGGKFDIWNLTMIAPDRSIVPNPLQPRKLVSSMCVFHFVHIQSIALLPEGTEMSAKARELALKEVAELRAIIEDCLDAAQRHGGRLVVKTTAVARLRGLPYNNPNGEPRGPVFMTQWLGVHQFWSWVDSPEGQKFNSNMVLLTGGSYDSYLFTVSMDFVDLM